MFTATATGRQLDEALIPAGVATTVVNLAELHVGVLAATLPRSRHNASRHWNPLRI